MPLKIPPPQGKVRGDHVDEDGRDRGGGGGLADYFSTFRGGRKGGKGGGGGKGGKGWGGSSGGTWTWMLG